MKHIIMYQTNENNKIYLKVFSTNKNCKVLKYYYVFNSLDELKEFLAQNTYTYGYKDTERWNCEYFKKQNLTGNDRYYYEFFKEYVFCDENEKIIDVRNYKAEIYNLVNEYVFVTKKHPYTFHYKPKSHTFRRIRNPKTKQIITFASILEYKQYISPKEKHLKNIWGDEFISRNSSGWKRQTKCKHQWEKHLKLNLENF